MSKVTGKVAQIVGPVIDVAFEAGSELPKIYDSLEIKKADQKKIFERFYRVEGKSEKTFPGFGIGFGTTWTDEHCKDLKTSRELWNKGMKAASLAVDCMNPRAKLALEMTGTKCPQSMTAEERQVAFGAQASAEGAVPSPAVPGATPVADNAKTPPVFAANLWQGSSEHFGR